MKQAIAVGALLMQLGQQVLTVMQCGAQRLIERGHARRLEKGGRAVYQDSSAGTQARQKQQGHPEVPFNLRGLFDQTMRLMPVRSAPSAAIRLPPVRSAPSAAMRLPRVRSAPSAAKTLLVRLAASKEAIRYLFIWVSSEEWGKWLR